MITSVKGTRDLLPPETRVWSRVETLAKETFALYGYDEIRAFRAARPSQGLMRALLRTVITTYGSDFATANCEFRREGGAMMGR